MSSKLIISGIRSIEECLTHNPQRVQKLLLPPGKLSPRVEHLKFLAQKNGIKFETNPKPDPEEPVLAIMKDYQYADLETLASDFQVQIQEGKRPVVVLLDGVTDAHNLGAILRTAAFMGIDAVVLPKDRAAGINDAVYRIASGGVEHIKIAQVTNISSALKTLKDSGFWVVGFSEHAEKTLSEVQLDFAPVIVIGNEEKGMRPLTKDNCDYLAKLPNRGGLESLNASVAASLAMAWAVKLF